MSAYYNECDPHAAQWLRNLIAEGLIPDGLVDERSIVDVQAQDLKGYVQCHFFAGIGGWPLALQLAGWPEDTPAWSGSAPCQPFSSAGKRKGAKDERHLWPAWFRLLRECRPHVVVGEQVASAVGHGWLDGVCADLEGEGYAVGAAVLGAHGVGAPHIRQRLYWVADRDGQHARHDAEAEPARESESRGDRRVGDADDCGRRRKEPHLLQGGSRQADPDAAGTGRAGGVGDAAGNDQRRQAKSTMHRQGSETRRSGSAGRLGDAERAGDAHDGREAAPEATCCVQSAHGQRERLRTDPWQPSDLVPCADGKARRTQPGIQCLVDGVPFRLADGRTREGTSRIQLLKGLGNAIVPQVAAAFIRAYCEALAPTFDPG